MRWVGDLKATQASVPTNGLVVSHLGMGDGGRHEGGVGGFGVGGGFGSGGYGRRFRRWREDRSLEFGFGAGFGEFGK